MKPSTSIIILNFNGKDKLKDNLPPILDNLRQDFPVEIIVVDNNSTDRSVSYLSSSFPNVKIVALKKNIGFSKGLNEGAKIASHNLLFFLNNDVRVSFGFLKPLVEHFEDPGVFGVSPKVLRPQQKMLNESIITGQFKGGVISPEFSIAQKYKVPDKFLEVFSLCGAAMIINKDKYFKIGCLDEMLYPFYYEETDLSYRALKNGWKIIYEPNSVVYHMHNQTIGKYLSKSKALWSYRKNQYLCTWKNIADPWLLFIHIIGMIIPKLLIPNIIEWKAFFSALKQINEVFDKRKKQNAFNLLTDREVFRIASQQIEAIKFAASAPTPSATGG